jgi:hypothetical protein
MILFVIIIILSFSYYFSRTLKTGERHLFKVSLKGNNETLEPQCVTCGLNLSLVGNRDVNESSTIKTSSTPSKVSNKEGSSQKAVKNQQHCSAFDAFFSPSFSHCVIECKGPDVPVSVLFSSVDAVDDDDLSQHGEPMASGLKFKGYEADSELPRASRARDAGRRRGDLVVTGDENFMSTMRLATGDVVENNYFVDSPPAAATFGRPASQVHTRTMDTKIKNIFRLSKVLYLF